MNAPRGFTLLELSIVLSISALVVPGAYLTWRNLEAEIAVAQWDLDCAEVTRTVFEELSRDGRSGTVAADAVTFTPHELCGTVTWQVMAGGALVRTAPEACGGTRALARGVEALRRVAGGVELELAFEVRPDFVQRRLLFFPLGGTP